MNLLSELNGLSINATVHFALVPFQLMIRPTIWPILQAIKYIHQQLHTDVGNFAGAFENLSVIIF